MRYGRAYIGKDVFTFMNKQYIDERTEEWYGVKHGHDSWLGQRMKAVDRVWREDLEHQTRKAFEATADEWNRNGPDPKIKRE